jgi:hypothetical protein
MADNIVTVESVGYIQKTIVEVISMRDQFAMAALTGMIADPNGPRSMCRAILRALLNF